MKRSVHASRSPSRLHDCCDLALAVLRRLRRPSRAAPRRVGRGRAADSSPKRWKDVATAADEQRIARAGPRLAGSAGRGAGAASPARSTAGRRAASSRAPALPRPAPTPGSYNCRLIKLGKANAKGRGVRALQAVLLLRPGRGRPADHRQADRQPAPGRPPVGGRQARPPDLPRQPGARRRGAAARLWRRSQARHGRSVRAHRAVPWRLVIPWPQSTSKLDVFELTPVATSSRNETSDARALADPDEVRAHPRRRRRRRRADHLFRDCSPCSATISRGPRCARCARCWAASTTRPRSAASPSLRCWSCASRTACPGRAGGSGGATTHGYTGLWEGPKARRLIDKLQRQAFDYWSARELSARGHGRTAHLHRQPRTTTASASTAGSSATCPTSASTSSRAGRGPGSCALDGKRAAPGDRIEAGQTIRVPPRRSCAGARRRGRSASASR